MEDRTVFTEYCCPVCEVEIIRKHEGMGQRLKKCIGKDQSKIIPLCNAKTICIN